MTKIKDALTVLPSRTIGLTFLLALAYDSYKSYWAIPELLAVVVGFAAIVGSAYLMMEIVMGLTNNMYIDVAILGALSYWAAGAIQSIFKLIDINIFTIDQVVFAILFGGMAAAVLYVTRKWKMS